MAVKSPLYFDKKMGMSIQSNVALYSNPDFLVDTSIPALYCQNFLVPVIPTFKIYCSYLNLLCRHWALTPFCVCIEEVWLYKLLLKEYVVVFISVMNLGYSKILRSVPSIFCVCHIFKEKSDCNVVSWLCSTSLPLVQ